MALGCHQAMLSNAADEGCGFWSHEEPCLHPACLELHLEEPGAPAPTCLPAVRATVLFAMGHIRREGPERGRENPPARSPKSQPAAVGRAEGHPETPSAAGPPASHGPLLPALHPSTEPTHSLCPTARGYGAPHAPLLSHPTLFWFVHLLRTPQQHCYPELRTAGAGSKRRDVSSDGEWRLGEMIPFLFLSNKK